MPPPRHPASPPHPPGKSATPARQFRALPAQHAAMTEHDEDALPISKTRRKKDMEELQSLGEELVELPADRVKKIDIPEELRDAVKEAQRMPRQDEARRRQMQYIGKLMRGLDATPIREALADARGESAEQTAKLHRLEKLRADLLADEKVLHQIATQYPSVDLQYLRSLRRSVLKEQEQNKPPKNFRVLFQFLKGLENNAPENHDESL